MVEEVQNEHARDPWPIERHNLVPKSTNPGKFAALVLLVELADGEQFAHGLAENVAAQVLSLAANYSHILFPATAGGKNVAPRVAAKLDGQKVVTIPGIELPVQINTWVDVATRARWASYDIMFGAAVAEATALTVVKSA